jgi:hypothetical protein
MPGQVGNQKNEVIHAPALNFSKFTTWATGIGTLGAAVFGLTQVFPKDQNPMVTVGIFAVVAAGLLTIAIVTAVDVYSRSYVTAAQLKTSPSQKEQKQNLAKQNGAIDKTNGLSVLATFGEPFFVQVQGRGNGSFKVLAIGWDANTKSTTYLVARQHERPIWVTEDLVETIQPAKR